MKNSIINPQGIKYTLTFTWKIVTFAKSKMVAITAY